MDFEIAKTIAMYAADGMRAFKEENGDFVVRNDVRVRRLAAYDKAVGNLHHDIIVKHRLDKAIESVSGDADWNYLIAHKFLRNFGFNPYCDRFSDWSYLVRASEGDKEYWLNRKWLRASKYHRAYVSAYKNTPGSDRRDSVAVIAGGQQLHIMAVGNALVRWFEEVDAHVE